MQIFRPSKPSRLLHFEAAKFEVRKNDRLLRKRMRALREFLFSSLFGSKLYVAYCCHSSTVGRVKHMIANRNFLAITLVLAAIAGAQSVNPHLAFAHDETDRAPSPPREFRAAWIATVANIDWPSKKGLSTKKQKAELIALLDMAARLHLNAVILQVRPSCDALYQSDLEPWSEFLTGKMGKAPVPFYDPLTFAVEQAHARGIELHAWFNPYRALHPSATSEVSEKHISKREPQVVKKYGKYLWLDPGEPDAVDHTINVILDVVRRYDIDGVHLDDYFYPYPVKDKDGNVVPFPDEPSWKKAQAGGEQLTRDDWRRQNVDRFVERLYREIKQQKREVKFGISPFGIWRPGHPAQIKGFDQYAVLYADARKWFDEGWLDYFTPQLYWKIAPPAQSYPVLLDWWQKQNLKSRHLWPGNYTSKLFAEGKQRWPASEIVDQVKLTQACTQATGNVHFSIKALAKNSEGIAEKLLAGPYQLPALVPATPWLAEPDTSSPEKPVLSLVDSDSRDLSDSKIRKNDAKSHPETSRSAVLPPGSSCVHSTRLQLKSATGTSPWLWVVRVRYGSQWTFEILPGHRGEYHIPTRCSGDDDCHAPEEVAVSTVDRIGRESPSAFLSLPSP